MRFGVLLLLLTFVYGFGLGGLFGAAEDWIKGCLEAGAEEVLDSAYQGDTAKADKVSSKAWTYFKRAHLHAGGMGAAGLSLVLLLACLPGAPRMKAINSLLLGLGALGYSSYWMFAGMLAPGMGSTGAAKEALSWLAIPSAAMFIAGTVIVLVGFVRSLLLARVSEEVGGGQGG
ncbi:MAG: hypothetical protein ACE5GW_03515 [Planctomycetota bacterium]